MKRCAYAPLLMGLFSMLGCSDIDFDVERYKGAVKDGFVKVPQACQIEKLVGEADHFISYHGSRDIPQEWNSEVYFAGRYSLTMQVIVKVDRKFSRITEVVGEPTFYLDELVAIDAMDGTDCAAYGEHWVFGLHDWNKVVKAKGDFSAIGIKLKRNQPVPGFDRFVRAVRAPRIQVRPDCGAPSTSASSSKAKHVGERSPSNEQDSHK
jgi:hypothetical protein